MKVCARCGNYSASSELGEDVFGCERCKDIKLQRDLLNPIEQQVRKNFRDLKNHKFGELLENLYLFGSYSKGAEMCGDIDLLFTVSERKLERLPFQIYEEMIEQVLEDSYEFSIGNNANEDGFYEYNEEELKCFIKSMVETDKFKEYFFDFRTCEEFPDCLGCHMIEGCDLPDEDYQSRIHTFCLINCKNEEIENYGLPTCFGNWTSEDEGGCIFLYRTVKEKIMYYLAKLLRKNADLSFIKEGLEIKALHLMGKGTLNELIKSNKGRFTREDFLLIERN